MTFLTSLVFWVFKGRLLKRDCFKRQGVDLFEGREKQKVMFIKVPNEYSRGNSFSHKNVRELMFPYEYTLMDGNIYI
jgi:hypothetical protein